MRHLLTTAALIALVLPVAAQERAPAGSGVPATTRADSAPRPITFAAAAPAGGTLVLPVAGAGDALAALDPTAREGVRRAMAGARFEGNAGQSLILRGLAGRDLLLLLGVGTASLTPALGVDYGGHAGRMTRGESGPIAVVTPAGATAGDVALGAALGGYRHDRYQTAPKPAPADPLTIVSADTAAAANWSRDGRHLADAVRFVRDLQTMPAADAYPEAIAAAARAAFAGVPGVRLTILDEADMRRLNMGSLLGVGQGARRPSRLIIAEYRGAGDTAPTAFVGKGITFDSGGISLKQGLGMWLMKADMSGGAAALGGVLAAAKRQARVNLVGIGAFAENMPGGNAQRPGDVVRTMNGRTIEVLNTDAEGRLVLVDATQYAIDRFKPAAVVTIATLTGAIRTALGDDYAGHFSRDEPLAARIAAAAGASGEAVWRMPIHPSVYEELKSDIADVKNVNEGSGLAGASFGAAFIGELTPLPTPWAHLDIAGVNWADKDTPTAPKGATGFGVRLIDAYARGLEAR